MSLSFLSDSAACRHIKSLTFLIEMTNMQTQFISKFKKNSIVEIELWKLGLGVRPQSNTLLIMCSISSQCQQLNDQKAFNLIAVKKIYFAYHWRQYQIYASCEKV
jgi:hypothetical protein